jgi:hypothetical protein
MIFKPRIFLSSTLNENLTIRNKIENFFSSVGAEAMLYEKSMTPSVNIMTYRKDILDADFIIFIIKSAYGERTNTGISGTHEEFNIALETNIPKHVYIQHSDSVNTSPSTELISEITKNQISYYYFKSDNDLLKRIKETTFTIAKEIMLTKLENSSLPRNSIKKISVSYDYDLAIKIISHIEQMIHVHKIFSLSFTTSTLFDSFIEPLSDMNKFTKYHFADEKLIDFFNELLKIYNKFESHSNDYVNTPAIASYNFKTRSFGEILVQHCSINHDHSTPIKAPCDYDKIITDFLSEFNKFKLYISKLKLDSDINV